MKNKTNLIQLSPKDITAHSLKKNIFEGKILLIKNYKEILKLIYKENPTRPETETKWSNFLLEKLDNNLLFASNFENEIFTKYKKSKKSRKN